MKSADDSCKFPMDEASEDDLSRRSSGRYARRRPYKIRSTSLTRPQLEIPPSAASAAPLTRSHSVSRTALCDACGRSPCRRPQSSHSFRTSIRRLPTTRIPSLEDDYEFEYISTRIGRRNPLLAKVSSSANSSIKRKRHPLLGMIGQAKSTSGGGNWMQLKHLFSATKTSQDEPVELVRKTHPRRLTPLNLNLELTVF